MRLYDSLGIARRNHSALRGAELGFESADPGKDPTTEPDLMMLWNVLDWAPEGRGTDWYPKVTY